MKKRSTEVINTSFTGLLRRHRSFVIPFLILAIACLYLHLVFTQGDLFMLTNRYHNDFFDGFFKIFTMLGDGLTVILVVLGMLLIKYRYALLTTMAFAFSSLVVQVLKRMYNSPRPGKFFEGLNPIRTIEGYPIHEWNSFPSGHSASAFTLAVVLTYLLPHKNRHWVILVFAILTAFSRVYLAQHFFEDVFVGALLGVLLTFMLIWWLENTDWFYSSKLDRRLFEKA